MLPIKSRRPSSALNTLIWFAPGLIAAGLAAIGAHPITLIPLLLANTLTMAAVCHAIGFDPEPDLLRTVLRRGTAHLAMFTLYVACVFLLVAWPLLRLSQHATLSTGFWLMGALVVALGILWRLWPTFSLVFVWDDAYPAREQHQGSSLFTATARSITFAQHLAREKHFISHFLPSALTLLVLALGTIILSGLYGVLPTEMRTAALVLYAVVVLPLGCLLIANRTLRVMLGERKDAASDSSDTNTDTIDNAPQLSAQERIAGSPEQNRALLLAARKGDISRALALLELGADPNVTPAADERDQRPVLTLAALLPDPQLLRKLIAQGAHVNRVHGKLTALLAATRDSWPGRADAVMTLLANGADPLAIDSEGNTPMHGAVLSEDPTIAAMLLDAGAELDTLNQEGISPLATACRAANWPLAQFLLERGAKVTPAQGEPALIAAAGIADDDVAGVKLLLKHRAAVNVLDARQRNALMIAAAEGHLEITRALTVAGADINMLDQHGNTALMEASRAGATAVVQHLAEVSADPSFRDHLGRDALILACQSPHAQTETVRSLLALGADPKTPAHDGRSALDHAATSGRWDLVALLDPDTPLPTSLNLETVLDGADTPAHLLDALRFGHWAIVSSFTQIIGEWPQTQLAQLFLELAEPDLRNARRWLLEHGLQAEARLPVPLHNHIEQTPFIPLGQRLFDALVQQLPRSGEAIEDLLLAGASPAGTGLLAQTLGRLPRGVFCMQLPIAMLEGGADPFGADERERTPLLLATIKGHVALVETLLARGCDPNCRDANGRTPLFAALEHGVDALPIVRTLIAYGADAEAMDANGETPLGMGLEHPSLEHWLDWNGWQRPCRALRADDLIQAAMQGAETAVQRLLELNFPVDARDVQGATALLHACGAGHRDVARHLINAGADLTASTQSGMTPLAAAVAARREALVALLLEHGAEVDQRMPSDATALMIAAVQGYPEITEKLLSAGADVNAIDARGYSALHAAAQFGFEQNDSLRARRLFDALLKYKANPNLADGEGKTPLLLLLGAHLRPGSSGDATHIGALLPVLLDAGAQIDHADQRGVTALHACAMHALLPPARVLLTRGVNRSAVDHFGRTASDVAKQLGFIDIAHELAARANAIPSVRLTLRQPAQPADP